MVQSILMPTKPPPWGRKPTHTKSELKSNAATGNSSHKQDTRQLVTCEFQSSTSKPDKEVHFRYSQRPQTQNSAKVRGTKNAIGGTIKLVRTESTIYPYAYKASKK